MSISIQQFLYSFSPDIEVFTDSSTSGWGGWNSRGERTFGFWSASESLTHINILELKAVLFMFQFFFSVSLLIVLFLLGLIIPLL